MNQLFDTFVSFLLLNTGWYSPWMSMTKYNCIVWMFRAWWKVDERRLLVFTSPSRVSTVRTTMLLFTCASGVSLVSRLVSNKTQTHTHGQTEIFTSGCINKRIMNYSPLNCKLVKFCTGTVILEESVNKLVHFLNYSMGLFSAWFRLAGENSKMWNYFQINTQRK